MPRPQQKSAGGASESKFCDNRQSTPNLNNLARPCRRPAGSGQEVPVCPLPAAAKRCKATMAALSAPPRTAPSWMCASSKAWYSSRDRRQPPVMVQSADRSRAYIPQGIPYVQHPYTFRGSNWITAPSSFRGNCFTRFTGLQYNGRTSTCMRLRAITHQIFISGLQQGRCAAEIQLAI